MDFWEIYRVLVNEAAPGVALFITQNDPVVIGYSGNRAPTAVAESVADLCVVVTLGAAAPSVAELVTQADVVALTEPEDCLLIVVLESVESTGSDRTVAGLPINHKAILGYAWSTTNEECTLRRSVLVPIVRVHDDRSC